MSSGAVWALKPRLIAPTDMDSSRWQVCLEPSGIRYVTAADKDLLSAAAGAGVAVPSACKNGVCELCEARLLSGSALNTRNQQMIPVGARLMMCRTAALDHLELEISAVMAAGITSPASFRQTWWM